jgi:hypothetical protein
MVGLSGKLMVENFSWCENKRGGYWCNELLLKHHLLNNDIKAEPIVLQVHY